MSRTSPVAVSIQAVSPALMGPPVTACGAARKNAPSTLTVATSANGMEGNSRIRPVLLLTSSKVIAPAPC